MIRILIADQSGFTCDAMRRILNSENDIFVVGCAQTSEELAYLAPQSDMVLLNADSSGDTVAEAIRWVCQNVPTVKVLVTAVSANPHAIITYIEAGACGYVLREESMATLLAKVRAAHKGLALISPDMAAQLMRRLAELANHPLSINCAGKGGNVAELTARECEILELVSFGYSNQEIADELVIGYGTVKNHLHNILKKLEIGNRHDAALVYEMYREEGPPSARGKKPLRLRLPQPSSYLAADRATAVFSTA